ncbi:hypothetical protein TRFO_17228 [Tritrichomonas foetus]|uniref:Uncharacterized protein n=1 Tax=Tritrichomonas foetus TaxID=1144522 RepID=A0A1J4KN83_9EUKA|nr:hypothetical protein TRFO_17228 [Tritrichomonas foetus]|eukprot:OHT12775.1 hypothetical protein TRFO_17228 [Tritrichomonas foetus]
MNEQNENENLQHSKIEYKNENDHERENYPSQSHRPIYSSKIQRRMTSGAADLRKRFGRVLPVNNARKTPEFFPPDRTGPRAPSKAEIKMFLEELTLIFPINLHAKTFCGVSVEENDSNCAKMLMFNIVHFLTLFSEFTGIVYDYRISIVDGWYKLEERLTGNEIKRDINSKNIQSNPYREAVISCLQKILYEFQLKPQSLEILDMLDAILKFHSLLT